MARRDLVDMYCLPETYLPPTEKEICGNTQYPNLNSDEYRRKFCLTSPPKSQEFYENLIANEANQVLLVTNDYRRRLWSGSFTIFPDVSAIRTNATPIAQHPCHSPISTVVFQSNDNVWFGTATGSLELWEVLPVGKSDTLGVCKVDSKSAHLDVISKIVVFSKNPTKFVTGSSDGDLKIWDLDNRDMMNVNSYNGAHSYAVTDLSVHPGDDEVFVSVSRDKSALIWDHRQVQPATGLLSKHPYHLTSCNWKNGSDNHDLIVIGDAKGDVFQMDRRAPDKIVSLVSVFNRPIRKIGRCGVDKWVICGNSTELKTVDKEFEKVESIFTGDDWIRDFLIRDDKIEAVLCMNGNLSELSGE